MVNSQFGSILKEFEALFNCPLEPDENNSCFITLEIGLSVQIEMDRGGMILIGCRLGAVHMGRYRNNLIQQALKLNNNSPLSTGVIGFSQKSNQLILFTKLNPLLLNQNQIITLLPAFINKAKVWKEAINSGEIPENSPHATSSSGPSGIFGLIK